MALGSRAPEHGATAQRLARIGGPSAQTLPASRRFAPTGAPMARPAPMGVTEILGVDAADRADAEQGYRWGWEVVYGDAHRSGACQTRAQGRAQGRHRAQPAQGALTA